MIWALELSIILWGSYLIYEERRTVVEPKKVADYLKIREEKNWPTSRLKGGQAILLLSGLIGAPQNEFVQVTSYPDFGSWEAAQHGLAIDVAGIVQCEEVRLLKPISTRPKGVVPKDDLRAVYGHRRFYINPSDMDEFVNCSENGIWPRIESQGACVLGLWTTVSSTYPMEITLLTGYHSPSHWEETRFGGNAPEGVEKDLWNSEEPLRQRRVDITLRSLVRLMRTHAF